MTRTSSSRRSGAYSSSVPAGESASAPAVLAKSIELVPVDAVTPHPENARHGDIGAIVESMTRTGVYRPIYVQRSTGYIIAGTHTWHAQRALGSTTVPAVMLDVDDATAKRILLADNRTADRGSYDTAALAALLTDLASNDDLSGSGYDADDLDGMLNELARDAVAGGALDNDPETVSFRLGDYSGNVSPAVYESFKSVFEKRRKDGGDVLLDDVMRSWLRLGS